MGTPSFGELKKHASFFFKEKIKTARMALTDVTPAQLLAEEVTGGNEWGPDMQTMRLIAKAAFDVDDYGRIVEILHNRFSKFDKQNWRVSYNSVILLEHLLTHGPKSAAEEFLSDIDVISEMESFQFTDDKGFNWGLAVRKKAERVLSLLENSPLLVQERNRGRKLTPRIQGFGSFSVCGPDHRVLKHSTSFGDFRMNDYLHHVLENNNSSVEDNGGVPQMKQAETDSFDTEIHYKANTAPSILELPMKFRKLNCTGESRPLLDERKGEPDSRMSTIKDHRSFSFADAQASASLLKTTYEYLRAQRKRNE